MKATKLKKGIQANSGKNCWAKARQMGDVIQETFITFMKPTRTVARIWWYVRAPAMSAMATRYTEFWIGAIYGRMRVSGWRGSEMKPDTYDQVADENL